MQAEKFNSHRVSRLRSIDTIQNSDLLLQENDMAGAEASLKHGKSVSVKPIDNDKKQTYQLISLTPRV